MIRSMTAFAAAELKVGEHTFLCELRSVNHRYCDLNLKIPECFRFAEPQMRNIISAKIKRGKIECALNYKTEHNQCFQTIDFNAVRNLLNLSAEIESLMPNAKSFSALEVLAYPGIQQETQPNRELLEDGIHSVLQQSLKIFLAAREREGHQLGLLIEERCEKIVGLLKEAQQLLPSVFEKLRKKLTTKINDLVATPDYDRLEQELVYLAQKMDVAEELERLATHVEEVQRILLQNEPIGRRLDFLMQEMNREANTLGAKSADTELTRISIELKVLIEQMREQIQNIE